MSNTHFPTCGSVARRSTKPPGPLAVPGRYEAVLTVDARSTGSLFHRADPRVKIAPGDLEAQLEYARMIDAWMNTSYHSYDQVGTLRAALAAEGKLSRETRRRRNWLTRSRRSIRSWVKFKTARIRRPALGLFNRDVARFVSMIQSSDIRPAKSVIENTAPSCVALRGVLEHWRKINGEGCGAESAPGCRQNCRR